MFGDFGDKQYPQSLDRTYNVKNIVECRSRRGVIPPPSFSSVRSLPSFLASSSLILSYDCAYSMLNVNNFRIPQHVQGPLSSPSCGVHKRVCEMASLCYSLLKLILTYSVFIYYFHVTQTSAHEDRLAVIVLVAGLSRAEFTSQRLIPNHIYHGSGENTYPQLYCYTGRPFTYFGVFASARIEFTLPPVSYDLYEGANETDVDSEFQNNKRNWLPLVPWRSNTIPFRVSEPKCIGLLSSSEYRFKFRSFSIDYLRLIMCTLGLVLFFNAHRIVRSKSVFYSGGVSIGVVASLLVIFFFISRMIPRRRTMLVSLLMGWSFSVYIFHKIWTNLYEVLHEHRALVFIYLGAAAIISFGLCYRCGPPTNEKTIDLMQWFVQFLALAVVYLSSDIQEVTLALCVVALLVHNIPREVSAKMQTFVKKKIFKPKIQLLSEEEFIRQGDEVTRIELEKLRKFAQSPECPAWKVMSKLKNPHRFGSFVMGESHLEDNEILEYETSARVEEDELTLLTDDESDEEESPRILPADLMNGDGPNNTSTRQRR